MARPDRQSPFSQDKGQHKQPADQAAQTNGTQRIEVVEHRLLRDISEAPQGGGKQEQQIGSKL
ncbi:hypothetical protein GCM10007880_57110 [Mesorhizobium amorphae]|nr:hypothetical protein GCM10007880_57110 [Mesorhizobium amorphae]